MQTKLSLQEIPNNNPNTLILKDTSYYNPDSKYENGVIEIITPGNTIPVAFKVRGEFLSIYNSANLRIVPAKRQIDLVSLPDGIYLITYSIKPNNITGVQYSIMRTTSLYGEYMEQVCRLFSNKCEIPKKEFADRQRKLSWIKVLIDTSKWMVEEKDKEEEGLSLYNEAKDLLKEIRNCEC